MVLGPRKVLEPLDAAIHLVGHVDDALLGNRDGAGDLEHALSRAALAHVGEHLAIQLENLEIREGRVHHVEIAVGIHRHAFGPGQTARSVPWFSEGADELPGVIKNLDPEVPGIGNGETCTRNDATVSGEIELAWLFPAGADLFDELQGAVVEQDGVVATVHHHQQILGFVHRDAHGALDPVKNTERVDLLPFLVEDHH